MIENIIITINTISWVALGYMPNINALALVWRMAYRMRKRDTTIAIETQS